MASNNAIMLSGNITQPEVRQTSGGKSITSARMVVKTYGDKVSYLESAGPTNNIQVTI